MGGMVTLELIITGTSVSREPVIMNVDTLTLYNANAIIVPHRIICSWYIGRW